MKSPGIVIVLFLLAFLEFAGAQTTETEWKLEAVRQYPQLGVKGSALNQRFVAEHARLKASAPSFFADPQWPLILARHCAEDVTPTGIIPGLPDEPAAAPAMANTRTAEEAGEFLSRLIVPEVSFKEAPLSEILDFITTQTKKLDPNHTGIKVRLDPSALSTGVADARISLTLKKIPALELVRYVTALTNLKFLINGPEVILVSAATPTETLFRKSYDRISPAFFGQRTPADREAVCKHLKQCGIKFPSGADASYDARTQQLEVTNSKEELELVDTLILAWMQATGQTPAK